MLSEIENIQDMLDATEDWTASEQILGRNHWDSYDDEDNSEKKNDE